MNTLTIFSPRLLPTVTAEENNHKLRTSADSHTNYTESSSPRRRHDGSLPQRHTNAKRPTCLAGSLSSWWWWEVMAVVLSVSCLILLIALLKYLDGLPYSNWAYQISPNAILAVTMAVGRAALLVPVSGCLSQIKWNQYRERQRLYNFQTLDQASRGLWGAVEMAGIASLGAIVVILSVAIDPLTQQFLVFPSRVVPALNETASAQKALIYSIPDLEFSGQRAASMTITIMRSLYGANNPLESVCTTGNCKYPDFVSLGVCSQCQDVRAQTKQHCKAVPPGNFGALPLNSSFSQVLVDCLYTTPGGLDISPNITTLSYEPHSIATFWKVPWTSVTASTTYDGISEPLGPSVAGILNPVVGFAAANYSQPSSFTLDNVTAPEQKPNITECALYFCEQKYENNFYTLNRRCLEPSKTQQLFLGKQVVWERPAYKVWDYLTPANGTKAFSTNSTYIIEDSSLAEISNIVGTVMKSTDKAFIVWGYDPTIYVCQSPDLSQTIAQLATSVTDHIRVGPNSTTVNGQAFMTRTFISVRWYWIIVPTIITTLSIVFFVFTIISTSKLRGIVLWESSTLALLACKLEQVSEHKNLGLVKNVGQMEKMAKTMYVSLKEDGGESLCFIEGHMDK